MAFHFYEVLTFAQGVNFYCLGKERLGEWVHNCGMSRSASPEASETHAKAQRREARFAADFAVRLVWVDLSHAGAARLKDISPGGARVIMEESAEAPRDVYLLVHVPGAAEPQRLMGEVRWQVGPTVGVRFEPPLPIEIVRALAAASGPLAD